MTSRSKKSGIKAGAASVGRQIHKAKQELEHMIDLNPQVMLLIDAKGKIVRANRALLKLLNLSDFSDVLGVSIQKLFPCPDREFFKQLLAARTGYRVCETKARVAGRTDRVLSFTLVGSGRTSRLYALIIHDITREAEQAVQTEREHKREAVQTLMGALMHNINQPLTVIMMRVQLMQLALEREDVDPAEFNRSLQDIQTLTTKIADTLRRVERPTDYVTQPYMEGIDILDIQRSTDEENLHAYSKVLLDAFLFALDAHSPGSTLHATRTAEFAVRLAGEMGLDDDQRQLVKRVAFLHDIGKIGIPDRILRKPERLSGDETEIMRRHPEIGYNVLRSFPFLREEAKAAFTHHEWFDGTGYPRGLKGENVPLAARITAVADMFDALRFSRAYQPPMPLRTVVEEITAAAGTQLDPDVVRVFKRVYKDLDTLFKDEDAPDEPSA